MGRTPPHTHSHTHMTHMLEHSDTCITHTFRHTHSDTCTTHAHTLRHVCACAKHACSLTHLVTLTMHVTNTLTTCFCTHMHTHTREQLTSRTTWPDVASSTKVVANDVDTSRWPGGAGPKQMAVAETRWLLARSGA